MRRSFARSCSLVAVTGVIATVTAAAPHTPSTSDHPHATPPKEPVAVGYGGAVASVDQDASAAGLEVLRKGGNAVDAAVATAAALGVTEPYSAGIGGGGYFVYYDAKSRSVQTIDGRETAPQAADKNLFLDDDGAPLPFDEAVSSGLSVGTPGTPATWDSALNAWGSKSLGTLLKPAEKLARNGFTVDENFRAQTAANEERFADFPDTAELFLPGGELPVVGSTLKNPDLAKTYQRMARKGVGDFYRGPVARDIVRTVNAPRVDPDADRVVRPGELSLRDLRGYATKKQRPSHTSYRGLDIYSMAPSSSGGTTVGEALNILETGDLAKLDETTYRHRSIEASRIAFADRGRWVGDPAHEKVPTRQLLSQRYADSRACLMSDDKVLSSPLAPGNPYEPQDCDRGTGQPVPSGKEGVSTTHLTASDRWGNVVSYTLTIESTGGSAMTVPGRGFLLNNELTDFNFEPANPDAYDPNLPGPGKRPRSSMAPTIVLEDGKPLVALGTPGGATIITTVFQLLTGFLDRGLSLPEAINAPRASQRDTARTELEPALYDSPVRAELEAIGHEFSRNSSIGLATGIHRQSDGSWLAAAEKTRGGGGSAMVVHPKRD